MSHVSIEIACEQLGITSSAICVSKKYKDYYKKSDKGTRNASFDLNGFTAHNDTKKELVEKVSLFTEYLNKVEDMTYEQIAKVGRVTLQQVAGLNMGYVSSLKLALRFREFYPFHFKRFHQYYSWRTA